jgi:penicillin-binding protein 2
MLQMASATATLVSGGQRFEPRLVREVQDVISREKRPVERTDLPPLPLRREHVDVVLRAMHGVTQEGTSTRVFQGAPYRSLGKTGTAQAVGVRQNEKYNAAKLEEHQRDHSLYIAAAPLEAPTVALAVVVENAGFGAVAAAPIARRVFDYLLLGLYPSEEDIALTRQGRSSAPVGMPRPAAEVPLPGQAAAVAAPIAPPAVASALMPPAGPADPANAARRLAAAR